MRNPHHTKKGSGRLHRDNRVYREQLATHRTKTAEPKSITDRLAALKASLQGS